MDKERSLPVLWFNYYFYTGYYCSSANSYVMMSLTCPVANNDESNVPSSKYSTFPWVTEGQRWPLLLNSLCDHDKGEFRSLLNTNAYHTGDCSGMIGSCKVGKHFPSLANAETSPLSLKPSWKSLTLLMKCYLKLQRVKNQDKTATEPFSHQYIPV